MKLAAPLVAALAIAACSSGGSSSIPRADTSQTVGSASRQIPEWQAKGLARAVCPQVVGRPSCYALQSLVVPAGCNPTAACGFTATDLETAYNLTPLLGNGSGTKVAVVEAGDEAQAATDLATYRTQYGLGTASFFKYNENGQQSNYPPPCTDYGWCVETALDIEMVSASCPKCTIYLMEAKNGKTIADFEQAEKEAVTLGATIVSNSWGCNDWDCGDTNFGNFFNTKGVAYLASTGDSGYGVIGGPSALASVIGVGGTQLHKSGSTFTESVWNGAGAGCADPAHVGSPGVPKPAWQTDKDCTYRTDGDVSAQAGVNPGVAIYISSYGGWGSVGGTSVASPLLAGVIALEGNAGSWNANGGQRFWALSDKKVKHELHYISKGSDGSCGGEYLCTAGTNQYETYSGPGGWGSPKGDKAF
ncbi:MAG: S8 family serine peptidase [Candidatus Eremiobacteraeota bacterium]|nr:S8 family serine peptidase [Candidatus Eremiobacteraeota bacterium]